MTAQLHSTDSWWQRVLFTPVGPRFVVGRRFSIRGLIPHRVSAGELICSSNLPDSIRDVITRVVKRTRLWQGEKADVARELIAHFSDAIAQGADAEDAARAFGDVRRAAKLIRLSKRRNRPLAWQAWHRSVQAAEVVVVLCIAVYGILIIRYFAGEPVVAHNYLAELNAPILALPQHECGWPLYREALMTLNEAAPTRASGKAITAPTDDGWERMVAHLKRNEQVIELARRAASKPHLGISLTLDDAELNHYLTALAGEASLPEKSVDPASDGMPATWTATSGVPVVWPLIRMLVADTGLALIENDAARAQLDLVSLIDAAQQFRESPLFIGDVFSLQLLQSAARVLGESLVQSPHCFDDNQLIGLAHRLSAYLGGGPIHMRYETIRTSFDDMMQRVYTDDGHGGGRLAPSGMSLLLRVGPDVPMMARSGGAGALDWLKAPLAAQVIGDRREMTNEFERQLAKIRKEAAQPMWEWEMIPGNAFEQQVADEAYYRTYMPLYVLLPAMGRAATQAEMVMQQRDATLTAIALELYRRRNGAYPQTLDQLVPELLPSVTVDRFDGQPLRYRLDESGPLLYSVGSDCIDDGGAEPTGEFERLHVSRYSWKVPNAPMHADWILWDGRKHESDVNAP